MVRDINSIFAEKIKKAAEDVKLDHPVLESPSRSGNPVNQPSISPKGKIIPDNVPEDSEEGEDNPKSVSEIFSGLVEKVQNPLESAYSTLLRESASQAWNEEIKTVVTELGDSLSELANLKTQLMRFNAL